MRLNQLRYNHQHQEVLTKSTKIMPVALVKKKKSPEANTTAKKSGAHSGTVEHKDSFSCSRERLHL